MSKLFQNNNSISYNEIDDYNGIGLYMNEQNRISNALNVIIFLFLFILGLICNLLALIVILFSNLKACHLTLSEFKTVSDSFKKEMIVKKIPKISSRKYLIALTLTNILLILGHFYKNTLNNIIYLFDIKVQVSDSLELSNENSFLIKINLVDTSLFMCKITMYIKNVSRLLGALIVAAFSIKRLISVYHPIKIIHYRYIFKYIFYFNIFISLTISIYLNNTHDLVSVNSVSYYQINNRTFARSRFHLHSLTPTYTSHTCHLSDRKHENLALYYFLFFLLILISYLVVLICTILIIKKLLQINNKENKYIYYSNKKVVYLKKASENDVIINKRKDKLNEKGKTNKNSFKIEKNSNSNNYNNNSNNSNHSAVKEISSFIGNSKSNKQELKLSKAESSQTDSISKRVKSKGLESISDTVQSINFRVSNVRFSKRIRSTQKFGSKNLNLIIPLFFLIFNLPILIMVLSYFNKNDQYKIATGENISKNKLDNILKMHSLITLLEVFYISNSCLTTFFLLLFGRLFRLYLKIFIIFILKKINFY